MKGYARRVRRVLVLVLALNLLVALAKLVAGWRADSLAVMGDGLHSGVDALANVVALVVLRLSSAPADQDHPYGHSRYETLAAFILSSLLLLTAFELGRASVERFFEPQAIHITGLTLAVMVGTLATNVAVTTYEARIARRYGSEMLAADAAHTRSDVYVSSAVLAGILLAPLGLPLLDPLMALGVALFIAWTSFQVLRDVLPVLTDRIVFDPGEVARVVLSVPGVTSVHDIRSRGIPREAFVQMHLVVDREDVAGAHAVADEVERRLSEELGVKEAFVHVEPFDDASGPPGTRGDAAGRGSAMVGKG